MNNLSVGFARVNITPMMGIGIVGYFVPRFADGVLDELYINALALEAEGKLEEALALYEKLGYEELKKRIATSKHKEVETVIADSTGSYMGRDK
mgnify:CR=1 FL=1